MVPLSCTNNVFRYPPKGSPVKFPEKPKKQIQETIKDSLQRMPFQHIEQRNLCRHELSRLLKLVEDTPGLIAPKYPVVMSCLALARVELLWYFRHTSRPPLVLSILGAGCALTPCC